MTPSEFWAETLRTVTLLIEGVRRRSEAAERLEWERTRWLAACLLQPYAAKGRSIKPKDIARFPWDGESKKEKPRQKPVDLWAKWDEEMKKRFNG